MSLFPRWTGSFPQRWGMCSLICHSLHYSLLPQTWPPSLLSFISMVSVTVEFGAIVLALGTEIDKCIPLAWKRKLCGLIEKDVKLRNRGEGECNTFCHMVGHQSWNRTEDLRDCPATWNAIRNVKTQHYEFSHCCLCFPCYAMMWCNLVPKMGFKEERHL